MEKLVNLIMSRFSSESPTFFKKIRNWSFVIGLVAATVLALPVSLPTWGVTLITLVIGVCTGISGGSTITTKDEKIIKETNTLFSETETKRKKHFSLFKRRKKSN